MWKRPHCSELNIRFGSDFSVFAEIEPFFELSEIQAQKNELMWFESSISQNELQKFIKFGQSISICLPGKIIKILPSGNLFFEIENQKTIITKKGHVIFYSGVIPNTQQPEKSDTFSIHVVHPSGAQSVLEKDTWTVTSKDGKVCSNCPGQLFN